MKNQAEFDEVFFPHYRKGHPIDSHPSSSRMEVEYQRDGEAATRSIGMVQNASSSFSYLHNPLWNTNLLG